MLTTFKAGLVRIGEGVGVRVAILSVLLSICLLWLIAAVLKTKKDATYTAEMLPM
jgi:hypothetical protein